MALNDRIRELIFQKASSNIIREEARKFGMKTLREDGMRKVLRGITTAEEIMRVTQSDMA
jgi:type II secretory ATPase GspE/PulE/Tfp pilus assembly ATPase PilB-like protein